jgi:hypothetical protein
MHKRTDDAAGALNGSDWLTVPSHSTLRHAANRRGQPAESADRGNTGHLPGRRRSDHTAHRQVLAARWTAW